MQKRRLGNSNLEVSAIGLGCMGIAMGTAQPPTSRNIVGSIVRPEARAATLKFVPS